MILEGQFTIPAPQERVWASIWDVPTLATWVPGCTAAEQIDEKSYKVRLEQQISMFKAAFDLLLRVDEAQPPHRVLLQGQGEDKRMGSNVQITTEVRLTPEDDNTTTMHYRHDLSVFGKLGALGYPIIQRKARETEAEFARRARAHFAGGEK